MEKKGHRLPRKTKKDWKKSTKSQLEADAGKRVSKKEVDKAYNWSIDIMIGIKYI